MRYVQDALVSKYGAEVAEKISSGNVLGAAAPRVAVADGARAAHRVGLERRRAVRRLVGAERCDLRRRWWTLLIAAAVFTVVNAWIKPIVAVLSIPFIVVTLGLFYFLINVLMLYVTDWVVPDFEIDTLLVGRARGDHRERRQRCCSARCCPTRASARREPQAW